MIVGIARDRHHFEDVFKMGEYLQVKYDEENLLDEEGFEWLQQKEFINGRRQSFDAIMEMEDHNLILMMNEGTLS